VKTKIASRVLVSCLAAGAFLASSAASADHRSFVAESVEVSDLYKFSAAPTDQDKVIGGAILVRDYENRVVDATLTSSALSPGHVYSIWIAVFNNPWFCSDPCGINDLPFQNGDPRVDTSVFYGGGFIADASGSGGTALKIVPGRTRRELFAPVMSNNSGLRRDRLRWAHIHLVLRDHGLPVLGQVAKQIGTASEACNPDPAYPPPSGMTCFNAFASFHVPY
jgi:hypothetical protein